MYFVLGYIPNDTHTICDHVNHDSLALSDDYKLRC